MTVCFGPRPGLWETQRGCERGRVRQAWSLVLRAWDGVPHSRPQDGDGGDRQGQAT